MCSRAWCRNHKVTGCENTMYIFFPIPVSLAYKLGSLVWSACHVLRGRGDETAR